MDENWSMLRILFKSKKKEIWNLLKKSSIQQKEEQSQKEKIYTGARFFLEKVLVYVDPITLYCSAKMVYKI